MTDKKYTGERFILVGENLPYRTLFDAIAKAYGNLPPTKSANKWVVATLWRIEHIRSLLFGTDPLITKETARSATTSWKFDNHKAQEKLGITFRNVIESAIEFVPFYAKHFLP